MIRLLWTLCRAHVCGCVAAWAIVSMLDYEIALMLACPLIEQTMARDPEYGYETCRWYFEHRHAVAATGWVVGAAIGACSAKSITEQFSYSKDDKIVLLSNSHESIKGRK